MSFIDNVPWLCPSIIFLLVVAGCTDADRANFRSIGSAGHVKCMSGSVLLYEGNSTGKIQTVDSSDGWEFEDAETHKFIRVSGACLIVN